MNMQSKNASEAELRRSVLRGLWWWELRRNRQEIWGGLGSALFVAALVGMTTGIKGRWFLMGTLVVALSAGINIGSSGWKKGYEEYSLGLPPSRADRFQVRFGLGFAYLAVMLLIALAAGPFGWFYSLGELVGTAEPLSSEVNRLGTHFEGLGMFVFSIGLGLALYVESLVIAINIERGTQPTWVVEFLPFGLGAWLVAGADMTFFSPDAGFLTGAVALLWSAIRLQSGRRRFEAKDVVLDVDVRGGGSAICKTRNRKVLLIALMVGLVVFALV